MSQGDFLNDKNKQLNNREGFTLIELLVVISIIGLLSTVVLASVQKVRTDSKWRKFDSELYQIRTAVQLYRENNNGNWPNALELENTFENLLIELKTAKVYPEDKIIPPQTDLGISIVMGGKTTNSSGDSGVAGCRSSDYKNVYYIIYFGSQSASSLPTKMPALYYDGSFYDNSGDGYYYCIDFR